MELKRMVDISTDSALPCASSDAGLNPASPTMPFYQSEGRPWLPPTQSPVPLKRGVYDRPDPARPGYVILEIWTSAGECIYCASVTQRVFEKRHNMAWDLLDEEDPAYPKLRAI